MADVYTRIGYIKGATGAQGAQGAKGDTGDAATIQVGSVTTVPYGQTANVVNSGTEQAAVFDFTIPQGRPGQQTTEMDDLTLNSITTSSASFPIPAIGETGKVLWGKVTKWFSDMSALVATKLNTANVVNNLTTTSSGYALDARQGNPNIANTLAERAFNALSLTAPTNNIVANTDLNNITTPGTYACNSVSIVTSLSNCPISAAFVLRVEYGVSTLYIKQTILAYGAQNGQAYELSRLCVSGSWGSWYGFLLPNNGDLNNYTNPGRYVCNSSSTASSLSHSPTGVAFVMDVEYGMNNLYIVQTVKAYSQATIPIYMRTRVSGTWNNWAQIH